MDNFYDSSIDSYEDNIKFGRKFLHAQIGMNLFNVSVLCFDWYEVIHTTSLISAAGFGGMVVTCLWSLGFTLAQWGEVKLNKQKLQYYQDLKEASLSSKVMESYADARDRYKTLIESLEKTGEG